MLNDKRIKFRVSRFAIGAYSRLQFLRAVSPIFYIIYKSDLKVLSACTKLSKCADYINLLVPEHTDVCLADEFINITQWFAENKMIINRSKTREIIFRRPSPVRFHLAPSLEGIEMSDCMKVLGINLQQNFEL